MEHGPVPESLRLLCQRQLNAVPVPRAPVRSIRKQLRSFAESARAMQQAVMLRAMPVGSVSFVDGGWANGAEWSKLLSEFDQAIAALRSAWQQIKDTEPAVQEVLATWRQQYDIAPGEMITEDSEAFWLLLWPAIEQARGNANELIRTALAKWSAAVARYFQLLKATKPVKPYGPQLSTLRVN